MGKQSIFEYVKLDKQTLKSKAGTDYTRYVVVSDINMETKKIANKLGPLGFKWNGREWWIFTNKLTKTAVDELKAINTELETQGGQTGSIEDFHAQLEELKAELQTADIPIKVKSELEANLEQYIEDIANATDERAASAELQKFLNFSNRFHKYSFNNIMYIYLQDPNATRVAGKYKEQDIEFYKVVYSNVRMPSLQEIEVAEAKRSEYKALKKLHGMFEKSKLKDNELKDNDESKNKGKA